MVQNILSIDVEEIFHTEYCKNNRYQGDLVEYFVYYQWRLLPEGDVRQYIRPDQLLEVDTAASGIKKRTALDFFKSQTTQMIYCTIKKYSY